MGAAIEPQSTYWRADQWPRERPGATGVSGGVQTGARTAELVGWGQTRFDIRFTEGNLDQMRGLTKETVAMQPDVIFVHTTPLVAAAQKETSTIPIVFIDASDPVGSGFVASLARPGGNLTGLLLYEESIVGSG